MVPEYKPIPTRAEVLNPPIEPIRLKGVIPWWGWVLVVFFLTALVVGLHLSGNRVLNQHRSETSGHHLSTAVTSGKVP